jgi:hypothetical protein
MKRSTSYLTHSLRVEQLNNLNNNVSLQLNLFTSAV